MIGFRRDLACVVFLLLAASAQASQISFTFDFGTLQTGKFVLNRGAGITLIESVYAGKGTATVLDNGLAPYVAGQSFDTYCVDLLHNIYSGATPQVTLGSMQDWSQPNPPPVAGDSPSSFPWTNNLYAGEAAAFLYNNYRDNGLGLDDKKYREAGLQVAIWEVLYEGSGNKSDALTFGLGTGSIKFIDFDSRVTSFAEYYLSGLPSNYSDLSSSNALWLKTANPSEGLGAPNQDFIGPNSVPEPASLLLVGSGIIMIGAAALRRWKR